MAIRLRVSPAIWGWLPVLLVPALVVLVTPSDSPRWCLMWGLSAAIYLGLKWATWFDALPTSASAWSQIAYFCGWPGMDARKFLSRPSHADCPNFAEWSTAIVKTLLGLGLIIMGVELTDSDNHLLAGWVEMIGLILALHCGLFHILSCVWRSLGFDAKRNMNSPLLAISLSDFWGHRWNTAFRDVTHRFVFRPLTRFVGTAGATWFSFFISGLIHELVITVPSGNGYGGPTTYFLMQSFGVVSEHSRWRHRFGLGQGWIGKGFAAAVLVAPIGLLFPASFVCNIIAPFFRCCAQVGT